MWCMRMPMGTILLEMLRPANRIDMVGNAHSLIRTSPALQQSLKLMYACSMTAPLAFCLVFASISSMHNMPQPEVWRSSNLSSFSTPCTTYTGHPLSMQQRGVQY